MTKEEKQEREKWEIQDAVRALEEYQKIKKNKILMDKAIKELKKRSNEYKEIAKELKKDE